MNNYVLFQRLKKKEVEPKIYAVLVESDKGEGISIVVAYSLEEAMTLAREDARTNVGGETREYRVRAWSFLTMDSLKSRIFDVEISAMPEANKRKDVYINSMIKEIINGNNLKLFKKIKGRLTDNEIKYIEEKLSINQYDGTNKNERHVVKRS